jgi:hypothetical protein
MWNQNQKFWGGKLKLMINQRLLSDIVMIHNHSPTFNKSFNQY